MGEEMLKDLLLPEIQELIENKDWRTLKEVIADWTTPDIADLLVCLNKVDIEFGILHRSVPYFFRASHPKYPVINDHFHKL